MRSRRITSLEVRQQIRAIQIRAIQIHAIQIRAIQIQTRWQVNSRSRRYMSISRPPTTLRAS